VEEVDVADNDANEDSLVPSNQSPYVDQKEDKESKWS
jgi:hypothetical protein